MLISRNTLQTFFDAPLPEADVLARELTMKSFEVEGVEKVGDDYVLNIDVLPNRASDCLSHCGVAREVALVCGLDMKEPKHLNGVTEKNAESVLVTAEPETTRRFIVASLSALDNTIESPEWLKTALRALGERSVSPIVDITNYTMLVTGQPLHAYDADMLDKVSSGVTTSFHVGFAREGEKLTTLDGQECALEEAALLIRTSPEKEILGLAGIKGGAGTAVHKETTRIVLEAASFNPTMVRKSAQSTKVHTSASKRFENNVPPERAREGVEYALKLFGELFPTYTLDALHDSYFETSEVRNIHLDSDHAPQLLGIPVDTEAQVILLQKLGCTVERKEKIFTVTPPWHRPDLVRDVDLVEEIGRLSGYSTIQAEPLTPLTLSLSEEVKRKELLRDVLTQRGYSEIITRSFRKTGDVELENPLAKNTPYLRTNLHEGLDEALLFNSQHAELLELEYVRLFEIGTVFTQKNESVHLTLGIQKTKNARTKISLEKEFEELEREMLERYQVSLKDFVFNTLEKEGVRIREYVLDTMSFSTKDFSLRIPKESFGTFKQFSVYPYVLRDIAVWTPEGTTAKDLESSIRNNLGEELQVVTLFDRFEKEVEGKKRVSFAFRLVFQSFEKTLSDDEINIQMSALEKALSEISGYEVR
ncbi:MAG: phenylalanine--tRNA ligase subunit beta [Candidatus Paceibacterota bacterium]